MRKMPATCRPEDTNPLPSLLTASKRGKQVGAVHSEVRKRRAWEKEKGLKYRKDHRTPFSNKGLGASNAYRNSNGFEGQGTGWNNQSQRSHTA